MNRHTPLYLLLKEELTKQDHWKNKGRGNPIKGYRASFGKE